MDDPLDGIDLVIFDKDGTLIEFHRMWRDWVGELADHLAEVIGSPFRDQLFALLGVDPRSDWIDPHGLLASSPMSRIRELVIETLTDEGLDRVTAEAAVMKAWDAPDPVALARPTADLGRLFGHLRSRGIRAAVATSDDRRPTMDTLEALGIAGHVEALACADDGGAAKPAPDPVLLIAAGLGVPIDRILVVGDAPVDMRMGRAAGVRRVVGVLTGVGDEATLGPLADHVLGSIAELVAT